MSTVVVNRMGVFMYVCVCVCVCVYVCEQHSMFFFLLVGGCLQSVHVCVTEYMVKSTALNMNNLTGTHVCVRTEVLSKANLITWRW